MVTDWEKAIAYGAAVAAIVQAVVALAMMRGLKHARTQADAATALLAQSRESTERQLRAYVDLFQMSVGPRNVGQPIEIKLDLINAGQTPARVVTNTYRWGVVLPDGVNMFELEPASPNQEKSVSALSAGSKLGGTITIPAELWVPHAAAIEAGTARIVVVGKAVYKDIFGHDRTTSYRHQLIPQFHPNLTVATSAGNECD